MWSTAEWDALVRGAVAVDAPLFALAGALLAFVVFVYAVLRGPIRLLVAAAPSRGSRWLSAFDAPWLLSTGVRAAALAIIALALAGPVALVEENSADGSGIDLVIALDASGSMDALDGQIDGRRVTRLELAKRVVSDFVREREGDRIGVVTFGQKAFTQCPLTVDHRLALDAIDRVKVGIAGDATAIGEAIGIAIRRLEAGGGSERIVLLLTDGRHNAGQLAPETAARIARMAGVRIHAVGIGGTGLVPFVQATPEAAVRFEEVDLDRETLQKVASTTGGHFFHARKPEDLKRVAAAIDALEARPQAGPPSVQRASLAPVVLLLALGLLAFEACTAHGVWRRLP